MNTFILFIIICGLVSSFILGYMLGQVNNLSDLLIDYIKSNDYDKLLEENKQLKRIIKIKKEDF